MDNQRNFFITIGLSVLILTLWQVFYMNPRIQHQKEAAQIEAQRAGKAQNPSASGSAGQPANNQTADATQSAGAPQSAGADVPGQVAGVEKTQENRSQSIAANKRVRIETPSLTGSINLTGARIDDLVLKHYRETVKKNSPNIELLNPAGLPDGYYAEVGFVGNDETGAVPGPQTQWTVEGNPTLTPSTPVTLTFTNDKGLTFKRTISIDDEYMFTIDDGITNAGGAPVSLSNYGRVTRFNKPHDRSTYVLHEGMIGVTGKEGLQEIKYSKIESEKQVTPGKSDSGWLGITDKYWAVALVPSDKEAFQPHFNYFSDGRPRYQSDYLGDPVKIAPGQTANIEFACLRRRQGSLDDQRL